MDFEDFVTAIRSIDLYLPVLSEPWLENLHENPPAVVKKIEKGFSH